MSTAVEFIEQYKKKKPLNLNEKDEKEAVRAGWTYFHIALKKYSERVDAMKAGDIKVYTFSSYFKWYIKQGVLEYLYNRQST